MAEPWPHHTLPALTIWQPWATLIIAGLKPYEFRGYPAPRFVRGHRIAIHAGARPIRASEITDLGAPIADSDRVDEHKWGWPLRNWQRFDVPVPARGAQGFWRWRWERCDG
jgi:hypothetical protein